MMNKTRVACVFAERLWLVLCKEVPRVIDRETMPVRLRNCFSPEVSRRYERTFDKFTHVTNGEMEFVLYQHSVE